MKDTKNTQGLNRYQGEECLSYWTTLFDGCGEKQVFSPFYCKRPVGEYGLPARFISGPENFPACGLDRLAREQGVSLPVLLQTIWGILLHKLSGCRDLLFAAGVSGASKEKAGSFIIDSFDSFIFIRIRTYPGQDFLSLLRDIRQQVSQSRSYGTVIFRRVNETLFSAFRFDHMIIFEGALNRKKLKKDKIARLPVQLLVTIQPGKPFSIICDFDSASLKTDFVENLSRCLTGIISQVLLNPGIPLSRIEFVTEEEKRRILLDFNYAQHRYSADKLIHRLFEEQVEKTTDHIALIGINRDEKRMPEFETKRGEIFLSYRELHRRSAYAAHILKKMGLAPGTVTGILMNRSIEMISAILAILKTGGAYLPLNPREPVKRTGYMLRDSRAKRLLTSRDLSKDVKILEKSGVTMVLIEDLDIRQISSSSREEAVGYSMDEKCSGIESRENDDLYPPASSANLCYIIYTSGSTGNPKGVPMTHGNISPLLHWGHENLGFTPGDRVAQNLSYFFDWSVWEIFMTLTSGAGLVMIHKEIILDPGSQVDFMNSSGITVLHITPSHFQYFIKADRKLRSLKYLLFGAEKLTREVVESSMKLVNKDCRIYNTYGPTETAITSTVLEIGKPSLSLFGELSSVPIGKAVANLGLFIFDKNFNLCPVYVPGELCIAGDGLAQGYLNNPELTAEKFIKWAGADDPATRRFANSSTYPLIYRTGDLTRRLPGGNIEFLGRIDHQVKVRGQRIELGEIESRLLKIEDIKEAVVIVRDDGKTGGYLCAYIVPAKNLQIAALPFDIKNKKSSLSGEKLREFLAAELPDYMIPSYFVVLDRMPLNPNQKVDRKALPQPGKPVGGDVEIPVTEVEKVLTAAWSDVLAIEKRFIGRGSNFFGLGGHSLMAATLVSRIQKELETPLSLSDIFKFPTIKDLSEVIEKSEKSVYKSILPVEKREFYGLSAAQKRMYILQQIDPQSTVYNIPHTITFDHIIDKDRLGNIFRHLIVRHESLRTFFKMVADEPKQMIAESLEAGIEYLGKFHAGATLAKPVQGFVKPFDLSSAPLIRIGIIETVAEKQLLLLDMHHIISDGVSYALLIQDFIDLYGGFELPCPRIQYRDFSRWENMRCRGKAAQLRERYWLKLLSGQLPVLDLPTDYVRPKVQDFAGHRIHFYLNKAESKAIISLANRNNTTPYMLFLSFFYILLSKLSGREDIIIGTPVAARLHPDLEQVVGMFVNTIALRHYPCGEKSFPDFLKEVKDRTLEAFENREYPFDILVKRVTAGRDISRNPIFDVLFNMLNQSDYLGDMSSLNEKNLCSYEKDTSILDLTLTAQYYKEKFFFNFEYRTKLFARQTVERFIGYFKNIVAQILRNNNWKIEKIEIISVEEKKRLLYECNDTKSEYPGSKTIHELFSEQVERSRGMTALVFENNNLSFDELNNRANRLSRKLREKAVESETVVGIIADHSFEMVTGILAILKTGGGYCPIDGDYPFQRIRQMVEDCNIKIILHRQCKHDFTGNRFESIDLADPRLFSGDKKNLPVVNGPESMAYIMYTSGSSGRPKGVLVSHRNVNRLVLNTNYVHLSSRTRILQTGAPVFDAATFELWGSLLNGGCLIFTRKEIILEAQKLGAVLLKYDINTLWLSSPLFNSLLTQNDGIFSSLHYLLVGGDVLSPGFIAKVREKNRDLKIVNGYGPTENTTFSTCHTITASYDESIPIGKPIANSTAYILDPYRRALPLYVPGELYVGGDGVSRGYVNNIELTAEKFVTNPFNGDDRLYRTGDICCRLPGGEITFLGRTDDQVKIRGFRVEPAEIQNHLLTVEGIRDAVLIPTTKNSSEKVLTAYLVSGKKLDIAAIRESLSQALPLYMIPAYFVRIENIPLTANGKVNRELLPDPEIKAPPNYAVPQDEYEVRLAEIWSQVLNVENQAIGRDADFFELGGHSLKAVGIAARIHKQFNVLVPLVNIFRLPVLKEFARFMATSLKNRYKEIAAGEKKEYYMLSSAQKRLYFLHQLKPGNVVYNIPQLSVLGSRTGRDRLDTIFRRLIARHEILRTGFEMVNGEPVQRVIDMEDIRFNIEYHKTDNNEGQSIVNRFIRPFDLETAPLFRVCLMVTGSEENLMLIDMHHIISDGLSVDLLRREFEMLEKGKNVPALRVRYRDYVAWQNREEGREIQKRQEEYWGAVFSGEIQVLHLPYDFPRPAVQHFAGDVSKFATGREETESLCIFAGLYGATLFMVLTAAYNILLAKLSGQDDIVIGIATAGRRHLDLGNVLGMFVNTLALRNRPVGDRVFPGFLEELRDRVLAAFENQDYPFEELVEKIVPSRDAGRNPVFDVMFVMQNKNDAAAGLSALHAEYPYRVCEIENPISKFDMTLSGKETDDGLLFSIRYNSRLFTRGTIDRFVCYYKRILKEIAENPHRSIAEIEILSPEEKKQLLHEFNDTFVKIPGNMTVHRLFEEQVERTPAGAVLSYGDLQLSYAALNKRANRLARKLSESGVCAETLVGVMLSHPVDVVTAILGILKAGGAYLPLDPEYPGERKMFMVENSGARHLISETNTHKGVEHFIDIKNESLDSGEDSNLHSPVGAANMVYLVYTSGTTGLPKGVVLEHRSVVNTLLCRKEEYGLNGRDTALQLFSYSFDGFVTSFFTPVISGAKVVLAGKNEVREPLRIKEAIVRNRVSHFISVPALYLLIIELLSPEESRSLKIITLAGDVLLPNILEKTRALNDKIEVVNEYGVTEAAVMSTLNRNQQKQEKISIGRPIWNTKIYIVNEQMALQPVGVAGEICIAGPGLAREYLNNASFTAQKFMASPFSAGERIYRTGDRGRWLPGGYIEYLGRSDNQVKVRGFRIELGEVEEQLLKLQGIKEAAATVKEDQIGEKNLCAYLVSDYELDVDRLRDDLSRVLPNYMMPAYFMRIEKIPLTAAGKINRDLLPEAEIAAPGAHTAYRDEIEERLTEIWSRVLQVEKGKVGIDSNFFSIGGHSLRATTLAAGIHKTFEVVLPVSEVFVNPTIRRLAGYIRSAAKSKYTAIACTEKREYYPLSSAQERLFIQRQMGEGNISYNTPLVMKLAGQTDCRKLTGIFETLIQRHESFRTSFHLFGSAPVQRVHPVVEFKVEYYEATEAEFQRVIDGFVRVFDLRDAPLLRVGMIKGPGEQCLLMIDIHHIITDGLSNELMLKELAILSEGGELPALRVCYRDFASWQNRLFSSGILGEQEEYWSEQFRDQSPLLNLPTDFPAPKLLDYTGDVIRFKVDEILSEELRRLSLATETTLFMVMLTAYFILLHLYSRQEDIVVGTVVAGRRHTDLQNVLGMFVNMLAVRHYPQNDKSVKHFLQEVKAGTLKAFENQDYQFEMLTRKLGLGRNFNRNYLFNTVFALHNLESEAALDPGAKKLKRQLQPYEFSYKISHFDLVLVAVEQEKSINIDLEYSSELFKRETAEMIAAHYVAVLEQVSANCDQKIKDIKIAHDFFTADSDFSRYDDGEFGF